MTQPNSSPLQLSAKQAQYLALAEQGFEANVHRPVTKRRIMKVIRKTGLVQIDSVNVLTRAHYMPVFTRLGPYASADLDQLSWGTLRQRKLFEYWGHEASLIPIEDYPLYRWRMEDALNGQGTWGNIARIRHEQPKLISGILERIRYEGALAASDLEQIRGKSGQWWGWSETKTAMEYLFWSGQLMARKRRSNFEREYDVPERVIGHVAAETYINRTDAQCELICKGVAAMGVATELDIRKYFRLPTSETKQCLNRLLEEDRLLRADVEGWSQPGYLCSKVNLHAKPQPTALLVPFDPIMWTRDRVERIFGFVYRIEIYVPVDKRKYGYYVLPFIMNGQFVARVDLKTDRKSGVLRVLNAYLEPGVDGADVAEVLGLHLERLAEFLQLSDVLIVSKNKFLKALKRR